MLIWSYIVITGAAALLQLVSILRGLYYLRVKFPRRLRPEFQAKRRALRAPAPAVLVFVPCKGLTPELKKNINALLRQDYPDYQLFFITESESDPASPLLAAFASRHKKFKHVVAGHTVRCCQKNHNLLKGIDYAREQNIKGEIYVFADMDIRPASDWLANITLPLADPGVFAVSGFRSLIPRGNRFAEHLHIAFNSLQSLAMTENRYAGMWGGSMALHRRAFEKFGVYEKWSTAMVDDLSLTSIIKKHNLKRVFSPDCLVDSKETYRRTNQVLDWFIRQTQYAAVYLRPCTSVGILLNNILLLGTLMLPVALATTLLGSTAPAILVYHLLLYVVTATGISLLSGFRKQKKIELRWMLYAPCFLLFGTYCGWIGFFCRRLVWASIIYRVNRRGEVLMVQRQEVA